MNRIRCAWPSNVLLVHVCACLREARDTYPVNCNRNTPRACTFHATMCTLCVSLCMHRTDRRENCMTNAASSSVIMGAMLGFCSRAELREHTAHGTDERTFNVRGRQPWCTTRNKTITLSRIVHDCNLQEKTCLDVVRTYASSADATYAYSPTGQHERARSTTAETGGCWMDVDSMTRTIPWDCFSVFLP